MLLIDSHSHLNAQAFDADRDSVIERMKAAGMKAAVVIGCDDSDLATVQNLIARYPGFLFGAWALHPEYPEHREPDIEEIAQTASAPGMVAVGETGLDFYWCKEPLDWQRERFIRHIKAAKLVKKPLIIHARDSEAQALDILEKEKAGDVGFVMHCFCGDLLSAKRAIDLGGMVSFTGNLTFKKNDNLRNIVRELPLSALMLETDCPYMAPIPFRGKRCEPQYVEYIARSIADLQHQTIEDVARITTENAIRFFNLPIDLTNQVSGEGAHALP